INYLKIDKKAEEAQIARLREIKRTRDEAKVKKALEDLRNAMLDENENLMPYYIRAVESYATVQEISDVGREVFGSWKEPVIV
ncbi:methylmalonyl-CoA mutase family protein, partial [Thermoplasma sp.]